MAFDLNLSKRAHEAGPQGINLGLQFRSTASGRVQHGRSLGVHVYNGLVVLAESDEMRERGHERLQLREALSVCGRDPQPGRCGSAHLDCFLREDELVIQSIHRGFEIDSAIRQRLASRCRGNIRHGIFLKPERIRSHVCPDAVAAWFAWCEAEGILPRISRRYWMFKRRQPSTIKCPIGNGCFSKAL